MFSKLPLLYSTFFIVKNFTLVNEAEIKFREVIEILL